MKSFIIALLPGLEEETGEYFEKVPLHTSLGSPLAQPFVASVRYLEFWIGYPEQWLPRFSCKMSG
jgi:hypothetical protein